jgi:enoyl-[acyl-carrier protein] reductase I
MSGLLSGKKVLIMGVANKRSIAWGIAQAMHREGAELAFSYLNDRLKENVVELVQTLEGHENMPLVPCDVQSDEQIRDMYAEIEKVWGKLDVLVHCLAFARTEDIKSPMSEVAREGWKIAQDVSAYSLLPCAAGARPLMQKAGGGSIITLTYLASERVVPGYNVMAPAKAALECNVRYLAHELGVDNIRVNGISAGPLKTLASSAVKGVSDLRNDMEEKAPLRRNITQEEVGDVAVYLASNLSRAVTGDIHFVDAGFHIMGV